MRRYRTADPDYRDSATPPQSNNHSISFIPELALLSWYRLMLRSELVSLAWAAGRNEREHVSQTIDRRTPGSGRRLHKVL